MKSRRMRWFLAVAFAAGVGHLAWRAYLGQPSPPDYVIAASGALQGVEPGAKHLYLRRTIFLPQKPRAAWIQVLGRDRVHLIVNEKLIEKKSLEGFPVAILADLAPYLETGPNVIAVHARQSSVGQAPVVAVEGSYTLSDGEHRIGVEGEWRCSHVLERQASWWFTRQFDEKRWPAAILTTADLRAKVLMPPRAVKECAETPWVTPIPVAAEQAVMHRSFDVSGRPRCGWVRIVSTVPFQLAVNGILIDAQEDRIGIHVPEGLVRRVYDLTPYLTAGPNTMSLLLTRTDTVLYIRAELEVVDGDGRRHDWPNASTWRCRCRVADWMTASSSDPSCLEVAGTLGLETSKIPLQYVTASIPWQHGLRRAAAELIWIVVLALFVQRLCHWVGARLSARAAVADHAYLALAPATVGIAVALLATHDPRVTVQTVFSGPALALAVGSVLIQWLLLFALTLRPEATALGYTGLGHAAGLAWHKATHQIFDKWIPALLHWAAWTVPPGNGDQLRRRLVAVSLAGLLLIGFTLRFQDLRVQPLQWDEVENYNVTRNFLTYGLPQLRVHENLPPLLIHTSESEFLFHGLVALVSDDPVLIVRWPSVCFGTLTIALIFWMGRWMFNTPVGLMAAALYTFSPVCVATSTFGRYFSQLQFCALLTVYFFWLTVRGAGPINRRALWLTTASFLAMFLTWEASALLAPGMIVACLVQRRGRLRSIFREPAIWQALFLVLEVVAAQRAYATLAQSQFLWYGLSLSDVKLMAMWEHQWFRPWFYIWEASWSQDALLPFLGLVGAGVLAFFHPWRRALRFLLAILLGVCLLMSFTLPNVQFRYIYHAIPLMILVSAATLWAAARGLVRWTEGFQWSRRQGGYPMGIGTAVAGMILVLASSQVVELRELDRFRIEGISTTLFKFPNLAGPAAFVRDHMQPGDIVIASDVFQVEHLMGHLGVGSRPNDYCLVMRPFVPATLDDRDGVMIDRRDGSRVLYTAEMMEALFNRHRRIWYVVHPGTHWLVNWPHVSAFLRQNMRVVYQDWEAEVLFSGDDHRPKYLSQEDDRLLLDVQGNFLP